MHYIAFDFHFNKILKKTESEKKNLRCNTERGLTVWDGCILYNSIN